MNPKNLEKTIDLRHKLHTCPEPAMQETQTKKILMDFLQKNTKLELTDCGHWFYAFYRSPNPNADTLAFRADFDALPIPETCKLPYLSRNPEFGHKCGHDGHSAALAGFALEINERETDKNICFLFQHAEETGEGAQECVRLLSEKPVSRIFAAHNRSGYPEGSIIYRKGLTQCASKGLTIRFTGQTAHASQPEDGKNPAFAIASLITYVQTLPASDCFEEMVLCTIVHAEIGRKDFGISADRGEVSMTLRANREAELEKLEGLIRKKADSLAGKESLFVEFAIADPFPETRNDDSCIHMVEHAALRLGKPTFTMPQPWRASEDFGYYTKICPGAIFYVGNGEEYPPVHTGDYDFNDRILETIVDMFLELSR